MADGSAGPQPLRDEHNLLGLPKGRRDQERVSAANALYARLGMLVETLERLQILWTIENPTTSFLWDLSYFAFAVAHGTKHNCHACVFGSSQKKLTSFLSNRDEFAALSKFGHEVAPHDHEGCGHDYVQQCFNTAKEAEYPTLMCQQYALVLQSFLDSKLVREPAARMLPQSQPKRTESTSTPFRKTCPCGQSTSS